MLDYIKIVYVYKPYYLLRVKFQKQNFGLQGKHITVGNFEQVNKSLANFTNRNSDCKESTS